MKQLNHFQYFVSSCKNLLFGISHRNRRSGEKGIERVVAVAFPCLQYRVADPQNLHTNTILQTRTASQWLTPSACFGLTHAPEKHWDLKGIISLWESIVP